MSIRDGERCQNQAVCAKSKRVGPGVGAGLSLPLALCSGMKEQVTIRLFEDPTHPTERQGGRYQPDDLKGWQVDRGDTIALTEDDGGRVFGVVDSVGEPQTGPDGKSFRLAVLWTQD